MSKETRRFMRLIVFFDLPTTSRARKRAYTVFRRFLLKDGYDMLQWSVYSRIANNRDDVEKHLKRLKNNLPNEGSIRCLEVTEKQFANMKLLLGEVSFQEKQVTSEQILLF